jgi:hypothetical protein
VIKTADWIVDLGPEGGDAGGNVVAVGTPEEIAANPASYTGQYLKQVFDRRRRGKAKRAAAAERANAKGLGSARDWDRVLLAVARLSSASDAHNYNHNQNRAVGTHSHSRGGGSYSHSRNSHGDNVAGRIGGSRQPFRPPCPRQRNDPMRAWAGPEPASNPTLMSRPAPNIMGR